MPKMIKRAPNGQFVLVPISDATRSHRTHTLPAMRSQCLETCFANRNRAYRPNDDQQKAVDEARRFTGVSR